MTDGRIPGKWVSEPRFVEMSADAWCIFTKAIAWSNEAGTDGLIKRRYLPLLHPDGHCPAAYAEIAELDLWEPVADGYQFKGWAKKAHQGGLGQSLAEDVHKAKAQARDRVRRYREKEKAEASADHGVTRDVTRYETQYVGQDRTGQEQIQERVYERTNYELNEQTGELLPAPRSTSDGGEQHEETAPDSGDIDPVQGFFAEASGL